MKQSLPFLLNYDAKIRLFQLSANTWKPLFHNNCYFIDIHQLFACNNAPAAPEQHSRASVRLLRGCWNKITDGSVKLNK